MNTALTDTDSNTKEMITLDFSSAWKSMRWRSHMDLNQKKTDQMNPYHRLILSIASELKATSEGDVIDETCSKVEHYIASYDHYVCNDDTKLSDFFAPGLHHQTWSTAIDKNIAERVVSLLASRPVVDQKESEFYWDYALKNFISVKCEWTRLVDILNENFEPREKQVAIAYHYAFLNKNLADWNNESGTS
ncbi:hypothetical protein Plhal304r1_c022g0077581 [Plasmopara halstedii]